MTIDRTDFHAWADALKPHIGIDDPVFFSCSWYATSLLYYIHPSEYNLHTSGFAEVVRQNPDACIWWVGLGEDPIPAGIRTSLAGYREQERLAAGGGSAVLFTTSEDKLFRCNADAPPSR